MTKTELKKLLHNLNFSITEEPKIWAEDQAKAYTSSLGLDLLNYHVGPGDDGRPELQIISNADSFYLNPWPFFDEKAALKWLALVVPVLSGKQLTFQFFPADGLGSEYWTAQLQNRQRQDPIIGAYGASLSKAISALVLVYCDKKGLL
jgi:hypothetical protein